MQELILGGARSGKSTLAEQRAHSNGLSVVYLATATAGDAEMAGRIAHHQAHRPQTWQLVEEPIHLAQALMTHTSEDHCVLVECLTLWLTNLLTADETSMQQEQTALLEVLPTLPGNIILVSNEVGMGVVPMGELSRRFIDEAGRLHQQLAAICDRVTLVVAGLEQRLKG
jgi:adenosylcobinamide kinase/adenosylcobinamide-phosphate guanylyltransferase